ncbi:MAG: hypothetical protein ABJP48_04055 [Erythrobacter sp.]
MKKFTRALAVAGATVALAACGSSDDAASESTAETVEIPADEALERVADVPVEDVEAAVEDIDNSVPEETAQAAADNAADVAADVLAAAEAAEAAGAAEIAEGTLNVQEVIDTAESAAQAVTD